MIAENLYSQVDDEGRQYAIIKEIIDHRKDGTAVAADDGFIITSSGQRRQRQTTKGWEVLVEWKGGDTTWVPIVEVKESFPVELAEYAVGNKLASEPAFAWWIHHVLRR